MSEEYNARIERASVLVLQARTVIAFSGAGISTESGLSDIVEILRCPDGKSEARKEHDWQEAARRSLLPFEEGMAVGSIRNFPGRVVK